jgi:hypothetical protein
MDCMIRELFAEMIAEHTWCCYDRVTGRPVEDNNYEGGTWRCECGWTTLDHYNRKSKWIDYSDHIADEIMKALRSHRMLDHLIEALTGYAPVGWNR